jgi:hypothetical protein
VDYATDAIDELRRRIWTTTAIAVVLAVGGTGLLLYMFLLRTMRALNHARRCSAPMHCAMASMCLAPRCGWW